jgi:4-amino-4-deoxy-L-arabinose transferase-like glycosyltransferase
MVAGAHTFSLEDTFLAPHVLNPPPTRHALLAFLLALTAVLHIGTAAWGDLYDGAEGRIAGGAREMLESKQWLLPTNDGAPVLQTPPLAYWAVALSCKVFGFSAAAARLPIALAMLGSVAFTFLIGERLGGYWRGFTAGLIHVCSAGAFLPGRMVTPDAIFSLFLGAAIYCVVRGYQHQKFRRTWFAGCWFAAGLASLTKGPLAIVYLVIILGLLAIFFREARLRFRLLLHWANLLLFTAMAVPWFVWTQRHFPGFLSLLFSFSDIDADLSRTQFVLYQLAWWFPAISLILPGLVISPRRVFRPNEFTAADALPLLWIGTGLLLPMVAGERQTFSALVALPGLALFGVSAWSRISRPLRVAGIILTLLAGLVLGATAYLQPAAVAKFVERPVDDSIWTSLAPLAQIAVGSLVAFTVGALLVIRQRGEISLALALAAMGPIGFCLVEARSRVAPLFSLADAAQFLNPHLSQNGEVIYEGNLSGGSSLVFYLNRKFFLVNQAPGLFESDPASQRKYLDEHYLLEAWDGSHPIYLIIDESRVAYWRNLIVNRVHIFHQVTTCGSRVILSNQM